MAACPVRWMYCFSPSPAPSCSPLRRPHRPTAVGWWPRSARDPWLPGHERGDPLPGVVADDVDEDVGRRAGGPVGVERDLDLAGIGAAVGRLTVTALGRIAGDDVEARRRRGNVGGRMLTNPLAVGDTAVTLSTTPVEPAGTTIWVPDVVGILPVTCTGPADGLNGPASPTLVDARVVALIRTGSPARTSTRSARWRVRPPGREGQGEDGQAFPTVNHITDRIRIVIMLQNLPVVHDIGSCPTGEASRVRGAFSRPRGGAVMGSTATPRRLAWGMRFDRS